MNKIIKTSQKGETKLYNIKISECVHTRSVLARSFNGPYIGSVLLYPNEFDGIKNLRLYVKMNFDSGETYKQIYKIVLADSFFNLDRTIEHEIIGPWEAVGDVLETEIDLTPFVIPDINNHIILYAGPNGSTTRTSIDRTSGESGEQWTGDADTYLDNFFIESWYDAKEKF